MILADDEAVILKGLSKLLNWEELGIEIVGLCSSYDEVVACLEKAPCDILITDVSMPGKNGIEVIKYIREKGFDTQVIFISGFSEFSYARDALRNGAVDYLTKPVSREGILEAVAKAVKALPGTDDQIEKRLIDYGVLNDITMHKNVATSGEPQLKCNTAINIYLDDTGKSKQENELMRFSLSAKMEGFLSGNSIVFGRGKSICVLINHDQGMRDAILKLAQEICDMLQREAGQNAVVIVGKTVSGMSNIPRSYESAESLEGLSFYCEGKRVIDCEHAPQIRDKNDLEELRAIVKRLKQSLYDQNGQELRQEAEQTMEEICRISYGAPNLTRTYLLSALNELCGEMEAVNDDPLFAEQIQGTLAEASEQIGGAQRFASARRIAVGCIVTLKEAMQEKKHSASDAVIRSKEFIRAHCSENITLETVASHVYMNPYYFSTFFKKHTNQNFKDYLNGLRLENAKKLLLTTNLRPSEIAERTGLKNSRTLNRLFREAYDKTPSEYRKEKH